MVEVDIIQRNHQILMVGLAWLRPPHCEETHGAQKLRQTQGRANGGQQHIPGGPGDTRGDQGERACRRRPQTHVNLGCEARSGQFVKRER